MKSICNITYLILGIIGGYFASQLILLVPTDLITSGNSGDYFYTFNVLGIILIGTFFYRYCFKIIRSIMNASGKRIINDISEKINLVLYVLSLTGNSYLVLKNITTGDTPLFATIIIAIFVIILVATLFDMGEFYIAPIKLNSKKLDKQVIKENKKRLMFNMLGIITGIVFTIIIFLLQSFIFEREINTILKILIIIAGVTILTIFINFIIMKISKKNYNKHFKYYYTIKDYFSDTFNATCTILCYVLFVLGLNVNYYLAFVYVLVIKIIFLFFLPPSKDPDYVPTYSSTNEFSYYERTKNNNDFKNDIKFGYLSGGGSYFSMDIAPGISKTTYTDKNGKKTEVTSFDIMDGIEYKSIRKK